MAVVYLPLLGLRGVVPDSISIVAANGILALSVACTTRVCPFFWASRHAGTGCWGGAAASAGGNYWRYGDNSLPRVMAISVYSAVVCTATAWLMLKHYRGRRSSVHYRLLTVLACIFALSQLVRSIYFCTLSPVPTDMMLASGWNMLLCLGLPSCRHCPWRPC
jgi:hypothetical protein